MCTPDLVSGSARIAKGADPVHSLSVRGLVEARHRERDVAMRISHVSMVS